MSGSKAKLFVVLVLSLLVQAVFASSNIVGYVTVKGPDAPVGPIANAFVMVSDPQFPKQVLYVGQTNSQGFYSISGVSAGNYRVDFSKPGFLKGILSSFSLTSNQTVQINAQLVPSLSAVEVHKNNVKDETSYTITNPNNFPVHFFWSLPMKKSGGYGIAYPGDTILETNVWPHTSNITIVVDGSQVQKETTTVVSPPILLGNLTGLVKTTGGSPLGGAQIVLTDSSSNQLGTAFSLSDGSYAFTNQPAGSYTLTYSLTGYITASQTIDLPSGGGQAPTMTLALIPVPPGADVSVNVITDTGGNASGAIVSMTYSNGTSTSGVADGNGTFLFTNQPIGVSAVISGAASDGTNRQATASTSGFLPGSNSVTVVLPPVPRGSIAGVVTSDADGSPLSGVTVAVLDGDGNVVGSTSTAANGTYTVGDLIPDTYTVTSSAANYVTFSMGGVFVESGQTTTQNIGLTSILATVTVTVVDGSTGQPVPNALVTFHYANGTSSGAHTTDANGIAVLTGQPSGVAATLGVGTQDGTNRFATQEIPAGFAPGPNSLTIAVASSLCTLTGIVTDKISFLPLAGALVTVTNESSGQRYTATSGPDGTYTITGFQAGTYKIEASKSGYLAYFVGGISFAPGQTQTTNIPLQPATGGSASVTVTVLDATTGLPALGASVSIFYSDRTTTGPVLTGPSGQALFENQPTSVGATIQASFSGRNASQSVLGFSPGPNSLTLTIPPPPTSGNGTVRGVVWDAVSGAPIEGATVVLLDSRGATAATATTDRSGFYSLTAPSGSYTGSYSATGYATQTVPDIALHTDVRYELPIVRLAPTGISFATVNVTVLDGTTGSPVQGVSVNIVYTPPIVGVPTLLTDSNGQVTFTNQPVGRAASIRAFASDGRTANLDYPQFPAGVTNATLTLSVASSSNLTGHVYDAVTRLPLGGVRIDANDTLGHLVLSVTSAPDGSYILPNLSNPSYDVSFRLAGYQALVVNLRPGAVYDAYLRLEATGTADVTVNVRDDRGASVPNAFVTITYANGAPSVSGNTNPSGSISFTAQPTGTLATLTATTGPNGLSGGTTATFSPGTTSVTVVVRASLGGVSGIVVDGSSSNPLGHVNITLRDWNANVVATTSTGADGAYQVQNLIAGTYSASFSLNGYVPLTMTIPVVGGQVAQLNASLTVIDLSAARVRVVFTDSARRPIANGSITITYDGGGVVSALTDQSGVVDFYNQPVDVGATITASGGGLTLTRLVPFGFRAGGNDYELTPTAPSSVTLRILDPHNTPVYNATVTITYANGAPSVTGTTDGNGFVTFADQPSSVLATITVTHPYGNGTSTQVFSASTYSGIVHITPIYTQVRVTVIAGDGSGPLVGASVTLGSQVVQTDASGDAVFDFVPIGFITISATSQDGSKSGVESFNLIGITDSVAVQVF